MTKKKKIIITIVSFIVVFLFFNLLKDKEVINIVNFSKPEEKEIIPKYQVESIDLEYEEDKVEEIIESSTELLIINLAKIFTERFGSWSTDNKGINLEELKPLSSAKMRQYLNSIILNYEIEEFSGISTKSLATEIISLNEEKGEANIIVNTQRIKTLSDLRSEVYYQNINLFIILSGDKWLVEEANWE